MKAVYSLNDCGVMMALWINNSFFPKTILKVSGASCSLRISLI